MELPSELVLLLTQGLGKRELVTAIRQTKASNGNIPWLYYKCIGTAATAQTEGLSGLTSCLHSHMKTGQGKNHCIKMPHVKQNGNSDTVQLLFTSSSCLLSSSALPKHQLGSP